MASAKLSGPVGDKDRITKAEKKTEKFKAVANKPADVELVQVMLVANGFPVPVDGKVNGGLIKAIRSFQKSKCGFAKPDGIVDPGMKTWKAGLPKLQAKLAADARLLNNSVLVKEGGREKLVDKAEFERKQAEVKHKVLSKANMMFGQAEVWLKFCSDAEKTIQGADGFMMSLTEFSVRWANSNAEPPYDPLLTARGEAQMLRALVDRTQPDWVKVQKQDAKATKAYNKGVKAFEKFINARIGTAGSIVGKLEVVREVSFTAVEVYATARFIASGKTPAQAHAMAAAGSEAMKSSAGELGNYLAGNDVSWEKSGKKIFLDTLFAGAAGAVGGKIGGAFANKLHSRLSLKLAKYCKTPASKKALNTICNKILDSKPMQELVTSVAKETVGMFKVVVQKDRAPTQKEFEDAVIKSVLGSVLTLAPVKNFQKFADDADDVAVKFMNEKLVPAAVQKVKQDFSKRLGKEQLEKLLKENPNLFRDVAESLAEGTRNKAVETYVLQAVNAASPEAKPSQMDKLGQDALRKDAALRKEIEALIERRMDAKAKTLEKAR